MKTTKEPRVTWDGQGINDTDEYASRIAKFQPGYLHLGPEIARAINGHEDLAGALRYALGVIESLTEHEKQKLEDRLDESIDFYRITQALVRAEGK